MCIKANAVKRLYLIMNFPLSTYQPHVVGVVKQYPLYRHLYEDTKHTFLNESQMQRLGFIPQPNGRYRIFELDVPIEKLY